MGLWTPHVPEGFAPSRRATKACRRKTRTGLETATRFQNRKNQNTRSQVNFLPDPLEMGKTEGRDTNAPSEKVKGFQGPRMRTWFSAPGKVEREGTDVTVRDAATLPRAEEQRSGPRTGHLSCGTAGLETPLSAPPSVRRSHSKAFLNSFLN